MFVNNQSEVASGNITVVESYKAVRSLQLGAGQFLFGLIAFLIGCVCAAEHCSSEVYGYGIWSAIILVVTGCVGIFAGQTKRMPIIISYLILSVIGLMACIAIVVMSAIVVFYDNEWFCWTDEYDYRHCDKLASGLVKALDITDLAVMTTELILCTWSTAVASHICRYDPLTAKGISMGNVPAYTPAPYDGHIQMSTPPRSPEMSRLIQNSPQGPPRGAVDHPSYTNQGFYPDLTAYIPALYSGHIQMSTPPRSPEMSRLIQHSPQGPPRGAVNHPSYTNQGFYPDLTSCEACEAPYEITL